MRGNYLDKILLKGPIPTKKALALVTSALLLLTTLFNIKANALPQLSVNVTTDKPYYLYRDVVHVYGNLTYNNNPVNEGLVAIQIKNPEGKIIFARTVPAKQTPKATWEVEIVSFYSCDMHGKPKNTFRKPGMAYLNVTVKNNVHYQREILIIITVYDFDYTMIDIAALSTTIPAMGVVSFLTDVYIDSWVSAGEATAYACVWSDWLHMLGKPYCPERYTSFNIVKLITPTPIPDIGGCSYHAAFRLNPLEPIGNYEIRVCAFYSGITAIGAGGFAMPLQLSGDVVYDRRIDIFDVVTITAAYESESGSPYWNPQADVILSGKIDIFDVTKVTSQYDKSY
ncbi:MAG: hypothetical protein NZ932_06510 [Candidatus Bathyarchaeota archaeon]|nr:hypothetical protein [Candidatus Bathyarchaeota archaeon]